MQSTVQYLYARKLTRLYCKYTLKNVEMELFSGKQCRSLIHNLVNAFFFCSRFHRILKLDYGILVFLTIILFFQYAYGVFYYSPQNFRFLCMFVEKSDSLFCVCVLSQRKIRTWYFLFITDIIIINTSWLSE